MRRRLRAVPDPDTTDDGWVITVFAAGTTPEPRLERLTTDLALAMNDCGGTAHSTDDRLRFGVAFSIQHAGLDAGAAATLGYRLFLDVAAKVGMPDWPIVYLDVMTFAEQDRQPAAVT